MDYDNYHTSILHLNIFQLHIMSFYSKIKIFMRRRLTKIIVKKLQNIKETIYSIVYSFIAFYV